MKVNPDIFKAYDIVTYYEWHFNVRPSNMEPLLRLNGEAKSKALMEEKRDQILDIRSYWSKVRCTLKVRRTCTRYANMSVDIIRA